MPSRPPLHRAKDGGTVHIVMDDFAFRPNRPLLCASVHVEHELVGYIQAQGPQRTKLDYTLVIGTKTVVQKARLRDCKRAAYDYLAERSPWWF